MRITKEYRRLEDIWEISIFDACDEDFYVPTPREFDVEEIPVMELMSNIDTDIHILLPYRDGEDFILQALGNYTLKRGNFTQSDVEGRLLSKISPMFYDMLADFMREVYQTGVTCKLRFFYYSDDKVARLTNVKIVFEIGRFFVLTDHIDTTRGELLGSEFEDKSYLMEYVSQTGSFSKVGGKYSWSPGIYNILNRRREEYDEYYNIVFDLVITEDKSLVGSILKDLDSDLDYLEKVIRIRTGDGVLKYLEISIYSTFNDDGRLVSRQGLVNDVTKYSYNNPITKPVDFLLSGFKNSKKIALMIEPLNVRSYEFSEGFYNLIEMRPEEYTHSRTVVGNVLEDEARDAIIRVADGVDKEVDVTLTLRVGKGDNVKDKIVEFYMERFDFGGSTHSIGFLSDVTEDKMKQRALVKANEHQLVLIKEVHHRVKNNLQVLNSFLNLEKRAYKDKPNTIIDHMQTRLTSLALLHEKTYNTTDFTNINLRDYILDQDKQLCSLVGLRDGVEIKSDVDGDLNLTIEVITPLLLIVDELTMNAIKHAFPDKSKSDKRICKTIRRLDDEFAELIIRDNGVGIPDPEKVRANLGCEIVRSLVGQLDGKLELIEHVDGTAYRLVFPVEMEHTIIGK